MISLKKCGGLEIDQLDGQTVGEDMADTNLQGCRDEEDAYSAVPL